MFPIGGGQRKTGGAGVFSSLVITGSTTTNNSVTENDATVVGGPNPTLNVTTNFAPTGSSASIVAALYGRVNYTGTGGQAGAVWTGGNNSVSNTTVTIVAGGAGTILIGMPVSYSGSPAGLTVTAKGTSTGGAGTIILSSAVAIPNGTTITFTNQGHEIGCLGWATMNAAGQTMPLIIGCEGKVENYAGTVTVANGLNGQLSVNAVGQTVGTFCGANLDVTSNAGTITSYYGALIQGSGNTGTIGTFIGVGMIAPIGTLTNGYGILIPDMTASVLNIGVLSQVSSGVGKYNLYLSGSAGNYLQGRTTIGTNVDDGVSALQVAGSATVSGAITGPIGISFTSYLFANLPAASTVTGLMVRVSDVGAAGSYWVSDGVVWRPLNGHLDLALTGIVLAIPSSGSMANNGVVTLTTAFASTYSNCYLYFPANAIVAGSAAGLYFTQMTSTTAGTVFNNTYTSGTPLIPASPTPFVTTGPGAYVQSTSALTVFTYTVQAGVMSLNGELIIEPAIQYPNSATSKTITISLAGTSLYSRARTTSRSDAPLISLRNRGVANRQIAPYDPSSTYSVAAASAGVQYTINTAVSCDVTIGLQLALATDYAVLDTIAVRLRSQ